jgi:hypothetical protein
VDDNPIAWVEKCGWSALIRLTFKTGPIPTEWVGSPTEWALNYGLKPAVNEMLDGIKSSGPLVMDMTVRRAQRRRWFRRR